MVLKDTGSNPVIRLFKYNIIVKNVKALNGYLNIKKVNGRLKRNFKFRRNISKI